MFPIDEITDSEANGDEMNNKFFIFGVPGDLFISICVIIGIIIVSTVFLLIKSIINCLRHSNESEYQEIPSYPNIISSNVGSRNGSRNGSRVGSRVGSRSHSRSVSRSSSRNASRNGSRNHSRSVSRSVSRSRSQSISRSVSNSHYVNKTNSPPPSPFASEKRVAVEDLGEAYNLSESQIQHIQNLENNNYDLNAIKNVSNQQKDEENNDDIQNNHQLIDENIQLETARNIPNNSSQNEYSNHQSIQNSYRSQIEIDIPQYEVITGESEENSQISIDIIKPK